MAKRVEVMRRIFFEEDEEMQRISKATRSTADSGPETGCGLLQSAPWLLHSSRIWAAGVYTFVYYGMGLHG